MGIRTISRSQGHWPRLDDPPEFHRILDELLG
jgi:hypothetical protein